MKHLLKMSDLTPDEVAHILDVADELKAQQKAGGTEPLLKGKSVALMFSKNSTRTRTSFEVGVYQLGGLGNYMNAATELQSGRGEPLKDTARVLGRYYDCVVWRTYRQSDLEEFAEFAGVPVINGLTDYAHPCQVLADLMTIRERRGALAGQKLCFVGDGSNMANSLIVGGLLSGMKVDCVCPHGYRPAADVLMFAHKYGSAFRLLEDPAEGVKDADGGDGCLEYRCPRHLREREPSAGLCRLPAHQRPPESRKAGLHGAPLPARSPRRGDLYCRLRGPRRRDLHRGRKSTACPEGCAGGIAGGKVKYAMKNAAELIVLRRFWRSIRESNPGTGLPAYRISSFTRFAVLSGT